MACILQINFDWDMSEEELAVQYADPSRAKVFWTVPGLRWKIWLRDPETRRSGGIYLFEDRASAQAYLDGPIVAGVKAFPRSSNHTMQIFDVRDDLTAITGGPVDAEMKRS